MESQAVRSDDLADRGGRGWTEEAETERLLAALVHLTHARSLFAVLADDENRLLWSAGGHDFFDLLCLGRTIGFCINTLGELLNTLGVAPADIEAVHRAISDVPPGRTVVLPFRMTGHRDRVFSLVVRRRPGDEARTVQLVLSDITAFAAAEARIRHAARQVVARLADREPAGRPAALEILDGVEVDLKRLFALDDDGAVAALAQDLAARVTTVAQKAVDILRRFETFEDAVPEPVIRGSAELNPVIKVHQTPAADWRELLARGTAVEGDARLGGGPTAACLRCADDFARNVVASTLLVSPEGRTIHVLSGPRAGARFDGVAEMVRGLEVEENSRQTAAEFFAALPRQPGNAVFAMGGVNVEAWGRPVLRGGWQASLLPAATDAIDVRGLFHGLKNLLLHLQVLYVVRTRADVEQVRAGLWESCRRIGERLASLRAIAEGRPAALTCERRTVDEWVSGARLVADEKGKELLVFWENGTDRLAYQAVPGEMEDALAELVRNAFHHGAGAVQVLAHRAGDHLHIAVRDDGPGMSPERLERLRAVIRRLRHDPGLSTRPGGTGSGVLSVARAVGRFVDGRLSAAPGPGGRGLEMLISMKLPPEALAAAASGSALA